jgi:predicted kinase
VLEGGRHAILDATFLRRSQRDEARRWAAARGIACLILAFDADPDELRRRVRERRDRGFDASEADEAVLEAQMRSAEPLGDDERAAVFTGPQGSASAEVQAGWAPLLERLNAAGGAAGPSRGTNP